MRSSVSECIQSPHLLILVQGFLHIKSIAEYSRAKKFVSFSRRWTYIGEMTTDDEILVGEYLIIPPAVGVSNAWQDLPASYHSGAGIFSFADGHVETHKWLNSSARKTISRVNVLVQSLLIGSDNDSARALARLEETRSTSQADRANHRRCWPFRFCSSHRESGLAQQWIVRATSDAKPFCTYPSVFWVWAAINRVEDCL
jgi:prepilin-type processing-associated H-X9-DG protein